MRRRVAGFPGVQFNFSQVIQTRNDELISGINAQIAVKIFGEDEETLRKLAEEIRDAMSHVRGAKDLAVEQSAGEEHLEISLDRDKLARYGLNIADVLEVAKIAIGGDEATDVLEGQRRFAIFVRLKEDYRNQVDKLSDILVAAPIGGVQLKMRVRLPGASISVVSEPRAVATGSYAQLSINTYFVSYCLIRSLPLAVLTRFVATLTFNYTLSDTGGRDFLAYGV